jgi:hypothetical protein
LDVASVAFLVLLGTIRAIQKFKLGRHLPPVVIIVKAAKATRKKAKEHLHYQAKKQQSGKKSQRNTSDKRRSVDKHGVLNDLYSFLKGGFGPFQKYIFLMLSLQVDLSTTPSAVWRHSIA